MSVGNALSGSLEVRAVRWRGPFNGLFDARVGDVAREVGREGALERDGVPGSDTCAIKNELLKHLQRFVGTYNVHELILTIITIFYVRRREGLV